MCTNSFRDTLSINLLFVDPDETQLPESYFLDEDPILSSSSDSELPSGKATWEENDRQ